MKNQIQIKSDEAKNASPQFLFFGQALELRFAFLSRAFQIKKGAKVVLSFQLSDVSNVKIGNHLHLLLTPDIAVFEVFPQ
jgi:hypothetical protein